MLELQVAQWRLGQQCVEAWLRCRRSQAGVFLGGQDDDSVLAVQCDTLRPVFPSVSHDLAEMGFRVLELPGRQRAPGGLR